MSFLLTNDKLNWIRFFYPSRSWLHSLLGTLTKIFFSFIEIVFQALATLYSPSWKELPTSKSARVAYRSHISEGYSCSVLKKWNRTCAGTLNQSNLKKSLRGSMYFWKYSLAKGFHVVMKDHNLWKSVSI